MKAEHFEYTTVISGSFRKHYSEICAKVKEFEEAGIEVLSPQISKIINPNDDFVVLESDDIADPKTLENRHLDSIYKADCLYVCNIDGYLGASATMEIGYALALGKPIYVNTSITDVTLKMFCIDVVSINQIKEELVVRKTSLIDTINHRSSLESLQKYMHDVVIQRGFSDETPTDIMLLMVEEIGELAKSLRKYMGLKVDQDSIDRYTEIEHELADVFIYLLDLSNSCKIQLYRAFYEKEEKNSKRVWDKAK